MKKRIAKMRNRGKYLIFIIAALLRSNCSMNIEELTNTIQTIELKVYGTLHHVNERTLRNVLSKSTPRFFVEHYGVIDEDAQDDYRWSLNPERLNALKMEMEQYFLIS